MVFVATRKRYGSRTEEDSFARYGICVKLDDDYCALTISNNSGSGSAEGGFDGGF